MKANKLFMLALAAGAMVLSSCSSEDITDENNIQKEGTPVSVFTAGMETSSSTRTHLHVSNQSSLVYWDDTDAISIFDTTNHRYIWSAAVAGKDSTNCTFVNDGSAVTTSDTYLALYPYQSGAGVSNGTITGVVLPAKQTAVAGSYDKSAALMVATSTTTDLAFKNLNTLIAVTPTVDCTDIIVSADNELAGEVTVNGITTSGSTTTVDYTVKDGKNVVTLSGNIQAGNTYYISVLPGSKTNLTFTLVRVESNDEGSLCYQRTADNTQTLVRSNIYNLGSIGTIANTGYDYNVPNSTVNGKNLGIHLPEATGHKMVNLGIKDASGNYTCWAASNVGATTDMPYGNYYQWGDVTPLLQSYKLTDAYTMTDTVYVSTYQNKGGYTDKNYKAVAKGSSLTKDFTSDSGNDAARENMGSTWKMPTKQNMTDLRQNTVWVYEAQTHNGKSLNGYKVFPAYDSSLKGYIYMYDSRTGQTGYKWFKNTTNASGIYNPGSTVTTEVPEEVTDANLTAKLNTAYKGKTAPLFLPCAGYFGGTTLTSAGGSGNYWSSAWTSEARAYYLSFSSYRVYPQSDNYRYYGRAVRGVCQ